MILDKRFFIVINFIDIIINDRTVQNPNYDAKSSQVSPANHNVFYFIFFFVLKKKKRRNVLEQVT